MRRTAAFNTWSLVLLTAQAFFPSQSAAQQLEPGAYSVSPTGVNIAVLVNAFNRGDLAFDPSVPVEDGRASINGSGIGFVRSLGVAGRSANVAIAVPYIVGNLSGRYLGEFLEVYRSGLGDPTVRFAINLRGAPAMNLKRFAEWRQTTVIGASLVVVAPLGQYDPAKLVNIGQNRWAFKPEIGLSRALGRWTLEAYGGVWMFTKNTNFAGGRARTQQPIGLAQFHALYTIRRRMWVGFNSNFYGGGRTAVDGVRNADMQRNSRIGATLAIPVSRRGSVKFAYSSGAYTTIGGGFKAVTIGYQHLWGAGL